MSARAPCGAKTRARSDALEWQVVGVGMSIRVVVKRRATRYDNLSVHGSATRSEAC